MEVWSSSASEEDEDEQSTCSLVVGVAEEETKCLNSNNNNNNNNNCDSLCREVTQVLCSDRVGQVTKTYHDIKAVTHLLEEKERDLELAARIGQSLLKQNQELTARNERLDEQLEIAKEEIAQLRHELTMRDDLLQFYASTEEIENAESHSPIKRNESCSSLSSFVHYDFLQQKLKGLEEDNRKLRLEASELTTETTNYEEQEQELMMVCVEELSSVNKQVVDLSEELARKVEDSLRQQEEISLLLAQIVDLQARCKGFTHENEELNQNLNASRESQLKLKSELKDLQDKYSECEDMLCEAREDIKNLRNKSLPNSTVQRYTALASVLPMDSLAAEIEGTFRKGLDTPAPSEYKFIPYCSSDVWSGATAKTDHSDYAFMGSLIIKEVVNELLTKGLDNAKVLLLAGSSAGGTGVLLNVDHVAEQLVSRGHRGVQVRGLADSGWFLDNKQYKFTDCLDTISCAPSEAIKRAIRYWGGLVPESCRQAHVGEEWNCFFGYKVYPTLKSPVFVVQWQFDEAQLTVDNIHLTGQPVHEGQWRYIQNLGQELRSTLRDVPAMFAPACLSHELLTRTYWMDIQVKGTSLPRALHCWDRSLQDNNHINGSHGKHNHQKHKTVPMRGCPLHLIDSCPWPHCNPSCPTIRDQLTGQEMSVIQFLKLMGFDVQKMAQQQGMDPRTLLGMLNNGN